ncbi:hypothetical protein CHS0354_011797 [Potamilus streckersoni]|uniref:EML-like first beta-propeller domain-containing protein n=1 Tax=Potamilus streckersoni TaxID=2493646 RepID=A0AAE0THA5_9BIVA|nr:hypothetical protein CHS0354_011797 [Potamilus streckersoni]
MKQEFNIKKSWPEFVGFLERAQQNAWTSCPDLKELPNKVKNQLPIEPTPLDELSSKTRNVLVNKLRKKLSLQKSDEEEEIRINNEFEEIETDKVNNNCSKPLVTAATPITKPINALSTAKKKPQTNASPSAKQKGKKKAVENERHGVSKEIQTSQKAIPLKEMKTEVQQPPESPNKKNIKEGIKLEQADKDEEKDQITAIFETDTNTKDQVLTKSENSSEEKDSYVSNIEKISEGNKSKDDKQKNGREHEESLKLQSVDGNPSLKISTEFIGGKEENILTMNIKGKTLQFTVPDDTVKKSTIDPPDQRLKLHWVYGYRGNDCRNNIYVLYSGEIVYFMSYVAVIYHIDEHRQRHYREHTDDIKCIAVHSNGILIATGQFSGKNDPKKLAHIRVWRSDTLQTVHILGFGEFEKAVACVSFAPGQDILAAVDNSSTKKLSIWDTKTGVRCGETTVRSLHFKPFHEHISEEEALDKTTKAYCNIEKQFYGLCCVLSIKGLNWPKFTRISQLS